MTDWTSLAAHDFQLPDGHAAPELLPEALALLVSPDPAERDGLAYPALATWLAAGHLDAELANLVAEAQALLQAPEIHSRSFGALLLAAALSRDAVTRSLAQPRWRAALDAWAQWYTTETDLRSHDEAAGWLHAVAHGADVAATFAEHPAATRPVLLSILDTLLERIQQVDTPLLQTEDDRLALAAFVTLCRPELRDADREGWLARLGHLMTPDANGPRPPSAAFAVQVGRALLMFTHFGLQGQGTPDTPASAADSWRGALLRALHGAFAYAYGELGTVAD
ncbi:DUF2785 domain-containing protein [Deinococcus lacus]|uniref:DUF2785 domain-containing protein n=1 Tax=Deinococcus lacus TaxID=392561 RepID=A0ABW1YBV5_9DEIO